MCVFRDEDYPQAADIISHSYPDEESRRKGAPAPPRILWSSP